MPKTGDIVNARRSLRGLSLGDAYGENFIFVPPGKDETSDLAREIWLWTDDTHMALSIVEILDRYDRIDQDALAKAFARRFTEEPFRGYGSGAIQLLSQIAQGADWRKESVALFKGGSYGNGAAMRVAPLGAYFGNDVQMVTEQARLSAMITHAHPEGQAGAIAVAVAAAIAAARPFPTGNDFIGEVAKHVPESETLRRMRLSQNVAADDLRSAVQELGIGMEISAQDTVPFCIWSAAHHLDSFENAIRWTVGPRGDCDTTCAIVGGIVAMSSDTMPLEWLAQREPLPPIR